MTYAALYPAHDRDSCSDAEPHNHDADGSGCRRCTALLFDRHDEALAILSYLLGTSARGQIAPQTIARIRALLKG
jgi:hypothetical protein